VTPKASQLRRARSQGGEDRSIGWRTGWALDLAPQDGDLVAERQQFELLRGIGTSEEDEQLEESAERR
jgi:hypothetical protein